MNKKVLSFIVILVSLLVVTTFIYHYTQQEDINCYHGRRGFKKGEYEKAIKYCEKALSINPLRLEALSDLAYSCLYTGKYERSIECFEKILAIEPEDNKAKESLADAYSWSKKYEKSISLYKEIVDDTDDIEVRKKLAKVCIWISEYEAAKKELETVLKRNPEDYKAKLLLAKAMHYSGDVGKAVSLYEELLEEKVDEEKQQEEKKEGEVLEPEDIKELLAEAYVISKDYESAIKKYMEILKEDPDNTKTRIALAGILGWQKQYDEAISEYKRILEIEPHNLEVKKKLAEVCSWKKDFKYAEILYKEILEEDPEKPDIYASLGQILIWDKRYSEATYYFDLALSKKEDEHIKFLYGQALFYSGDYQRAGEILGDIIKKDPAHLRAKEYLADANAYGKDFAGAIRLYKEILSQEKNLDVKKKLADVLSWAKKYRQAIDLYDEILHEREDEGIRVQKARILGWARQYDKSIREYQRILDIKYDRLIELEMEAKRAYWNNRVKQAMGYYEDLIKEGPENVEAMFDLSQIYSYESMWRDAIEQYERILNVSPNHFQAGEALQKVELIGSHLALETGYEFFKAQSQDRNTDIKRNSIFGILSYPVNYSLTMGFGYKQTRRSFSDFSDVSENERRIELSYMKKPLWWIDGFYDSITYNRDIDTINTFGGSVNFRPFDLGILSLLYERERLENTSEVIREGYYSDNYLLKLFMDLNKKLKLELDYLFSEYSDDNRENELGLEVLYYLSLEPKRLTASYKCSYSEFKDTVDEYFSPEDFRTHSFTLNWRQFLNKEEIFFGADNLYYDLAYTISVDSENVVGYEVGVEFNWDINKRVNFNISGSIEDSSGSVYEDKNLVASVKIYF